MGRTAVDERRAGDSESTTDGCSRRAVELEGSQVGGSTAGESSTWDRHSSPTQKVGRGGERVESVVHRGRIQRQVEVAILEEGRRTIRLGTWVARSNEQRVAHEVAEGIGKGVQGGGVETVAVF